MATQTNRFVTRLGSLLVVIHHLMTDHYQSSSSNSSLQDRTPSNVHVNTNTPIPEQWTEVNEYYMEKRGWYQEWKSDVNYQLRSLGQQLLAQGETVAELDRKIEDERAQREEEMLASSSRPSLLSSSSENQQSYRPSTATVATGNRAVVNSLRRHMSCNQHQ